MSSLMKLCVGAAVVALTGLSHAALLDGKTLNVQYFAPNLMSPIATIYGGNFVVGPGVELVDPTGDDFDAFVDFSDTRITVNFNATDVEFRGAFVGARLSDVLGQIESFSSFTVNSSSTALGFAQSRLSFDQNNLFVNFAGYSYKSGTQLVFDIAAEPVPEPETYALMLLGLGAVGWAARRRNGARR